MTLTPRQGGKIKESHPLLPYITPPHADITASQKKCAAHFPPPGLKKDKSSAAIVYSPIFDATLGFPGEGSITVATYNINGSRGSLAAIFAQAKVLKIYILLLQELHFYERKILKSERSTHRDS
jgi:hypothetical protein